MPDYNKVILKPEIDIRPWSECSGNNCIHPDCVEKRKIEMEICKTKLKIALSLSESQRITQRKKLKKLLEKAK